MTRLLLQLGMRRIAYMGGCTDYTVNADRLRGYLRGFSDCGVQVDQKLIWTGIETSEQRIDALEGALEQNPNACSARTTAWRSRCCRSCAPGTSRYRNR